MPEEKRIAGHEKRTNPVLRNGRECSFNVSFGAGVNDADLLPDGACRLQYVFPLRYAWWIVWVREHTDYCRCGEQLTQQSESLCPQCGREETRARNVAARPAETGDQPGSNRVAPNREDDRYRRGCSFCCERRRGAADRSDDGHLAVDQIGRQRGQLLIPILRPAEFDRDVLSLDKARFIQTSAERSNDKSGVIGRPRAHEPDHRHRRLLRPRRERPRGPAAEQCHERAAVHSITSLMRNRRGRAISMPSAMAVRS